MPIAVHVLPLSVEIDTVTVFFVAFSVPILFAVNVKNLLVFGDAVKSIAGVMVVEATL